MLSPFVGGTPPVYTARQVTFRMVTVTVDFCYFGVISFSHLSFITTDFWMSGTTKNVQRSERIHSASYWPRTTWRLPEIVSVSMFLCVSMCNFSSHCIDKGVAPSSGSTRRRREVPSGRNACSVSFQWRKVLFWRIDIHMYRKASSFLFTCETAPWTNCCLWGGYDGGCKWTCPGWVWRDGNGYAFFFPPRCFQACSCSVEQ